MKSNYFYLLLSGVLLLAACSQSRKEQSVNSSAPNISYDANGKETAADTVSEAKLVKTADMKFKVQNVQKSSVQISSLANSMNGMVMDHTMGSFIENSETTPMSNDSMMVISSYITQSDMVVRVPSERMEEFLNTVDKMAVFVDARNMHIDDKSLDYLAAKMKGTNRNQFIKEQQKNAQKKTEDGTEVLNVKDELVDNNINNMRINDAVRYSTIGLKLYQNNAINREVVANNNLSNYQLPFFVRMGNSLSYGWVLFKDIVIGITNIWILILIGISAWFAFKYFAKRSKVAAK